jgi:hypothetical protein
VSYPDFAFHIPIQLDSVDRYLNLMKLIDYIQFIFPKVKIRVCEQDASRKVYLRDHTIDYFFLNTNSIISKNECYNLMALRSTEEFIIQNDCDYITAKKSYLEALELAKKSKVANAHNGTIVNINRDAFSFTNQSPFSGGILYGDYYSGITVYESNFLKTYKENINLRGWGFDSVEKKERLRKLNVNIERSSYSAFHMDHPRTIGSGKQNPFYPSNANEYQKISNMTAEELTNYITSLKVAQF